MDKSIEYLKKYEVKNILFLDMDGVVNSNYEIRKWFDEKYKEIEKDNSNLQPSEILGLARHKFYEEFKCGHELIFPAHAKRLNEVITICNVKLIWSTTWRNVKPYRDNINNARAMLERRGINGSSLMGYTPDFDRLGYGGYHNRMSEIMSFIQNNTLGITFDDRLAAIDDCNLSELENDDIKFFGTEIESGLTEKIKNEMIEYFSGLQK